jgi:tellurite resistance protein TehA-like permease
MDAIRDLHPGYFAFVMATGIISTGTYLLGPSWLSWKVLSPGCPRAGAPPAPPAAA